MKLDHCVLPSANLAIARELLTRLGFTVAPDAAHPFGITNCRVFFEDGRYLESVVLADKNAARRASAAGNVFVQRDRRFRDAGGDEGFSALALAPTMLPWIIFASLMGRSRRAIRCPAQGHLQTAAAIKQKPRSSWPLLLRKIRRPFSSPVSG